MSHQHPPAKQSWEPPRPPPVRHACISCVFWDRRWLPSSRRCRPTGSPAEGDRVLPASPPRPAPASRRKGRVPAARLPAGTRGPGAQGDPAGPLPAPAPAAALASSCSRIRSQPHRRGLPSRRGPPPAGAPQPLPPSEAAATPAARPPTWAGPGSGIRDPGAAPPAPPPAPERARPGLLRLRSPPAPGAARSPKSPSRPAPSGRGQRGGPPRGALTAEVRAWALGRLRGRAGRGQGLRRRGCGSSASRLPLRPGGAGRTSRAEPRAAPGTGGGGQGVGGAGGEPEGGGRKRHPRIPQRPRSGRRAEPSAGDAGPAASKGSPAAPGARNPLPAPPHLRDEGHLVSHQVQSLPSLK